MRKTDDDVDIFTTVLPSSAERYISTELFAFGDA